MKQYSVHDIFNHLSNQMSSEYENGKIYYYIHIGENGELVNDCSKAEESFKSEYKGEIDESFEFENINNKDFVNTVNELTKEVNEYLEKWYD